MPSNVPDLVVDFDVNAHWKRALIDVFNGDRYTHWITLVWNQKVTLERMRFDVEQIHWKVDKRILGSRCHRYPKASRSKAVFVAEDISTHPHVHSLWRFPPGKLVEFTKLFPGRRGGVWNEVVEPGEYWTALVNQGRIDEFAGYTLKKQHRYSEAGEIIWSDEFLPDR